MTASYVPSKEEVAAFYDAAIPMINRLAGVNVHFGYWDSPADTSTVQQATDRLTDMMVDRIRPEAGQRVLDVGCGLGAPAIRLASRTGAEVVGIATSPKLIDQARTNAAEANVSHLVTFEVVDAAQLPYQDESFDSVLAIESIVHMPDRAQVYAEIARVLRPDGRLVVTDFYEKVPLSGRRRDIVEEYRRFTMNSELLRLDRYLAMLAAAGLYPSEFLDITAETARHHVEMIAKVDQQRDELAEMYGEDMVAKFQSVFRDCLDVAEPNYMLLAATRVRRPED